jgi:hypothetical protein
VFLKLGPHPEWVVAREKVNLGSDVRGEKNALQHCHDHANRGSHIHWHTPPPENGLLGVNAILSAFVGGER